ncbi:MAG: hypothetical protein WBH45_21470 [Acidobacteriaceae bacterium]
MIFALLVNAGVVIFVVGAAASLVRQRRRRKARLGKGELVVSSLAGLAMGAMFLGLQEIVEPQARHMIVEEMKEEATNDENGEPLGGRAFHEAMRRIRRGEEVDEVTVRVEGEALQ